MAYINKDNVIDIIDNSADIQEVKSCVFMLENADVIERSKVDNAIEEFKTRYPKNVYGELELGGRACKFSLVTVLEILKRNIGE